MTESTQDKIESWLSEQEALVTEEGYGRLVELVEAKEDDAPMARMIRLCTVELLRVFYDNTPDGESAKDFFLQKDLLSTLLVVANIGYGLVESCEKQCGLAVQLDEWFPMTEIAYTALGGALQLLGDVNAEALQEVMDQPMSNFIRPD